MEYHINSNITVDEFRRLLHGSGLAERRPVDNSECLQGMLDNANLTISAWHEGHLVGIARSVTDFHYACYLSDLAVSKTQQRNGVGRKLIELTRSHLRDTCKLILLAAPAANDYYPTLGFENNPRCWVK